MRRPSIPARPTLLVGVGAAAGASLRWAISEVIDTEPGHLPWGTLLVNVVGCLAIGAAARRLRPDTVTWFLAVTGVLGGFTTWSTLANEVRVLADGGRTVLAAVYLAVTVLAGLVAVEIGRGVAR
jgi:CrcB protein